jgi:hypothetical protein
MTCHHIIIIIIIFIFIQDTHIDHRSVFQWGPAITLIQYLAMHYLQEHIYTILLFKSTVLIKPYFHSICIETQHTSLFQRH